MISRTEILATSGTSVAEEIIEGPIAMAKVVIIVLMIMMIAALGVGLFYLIKTPEEGDNGSNLAKALTLRIGIWFFLFAFILISIKVGWITPSVSINPDKFNAEQQQRINLEQ